MSRWIELDKCEFLLSGCLVRDNRVVADVADKAFKIFIRTLLRICKVTSKLLACLNGITGSDLDVRFVMQTPGHSEWDLFSMQSL